MPSVQTNGVSLHYDWQRRPETADGAPILFIMGLAGQLTDWDPDFVELFHAQGYQTIRFDNRDIGLSSEENWVPPSQVKVARSVLSRRPLPGVGYTLSDMAADTAGLLKELDLAAAHVVGVSMGAMIAQELAIDYPERVLSLCSIMSHTGDFRSGRMSPSLIPKFWRRPEPSRETAVEDSVKLFSLISGPHFDAQSHRVHAQESIERSYRPESVTRQIAAIAGSRDRTALLESLSVPTLVIHGLVDPLILPSGGVATARAIPGSRLLAFGDMGHDLPKPRWPEISEAIMANIARVHSVAP